MSEQEPMVDARRVADVLGVSKNTVYQAAHTGQIRSYRIGTRVRFRVSEVIEDVRKGRTDPSGRPLRAVE